MRTRLLGAGLNQNVLVSLAGRRRFEAVESAGCMVLAAAVRQDGKMATTVTEGEPRQLRMPFATSMAWQRKLATFDEQPTTILGGDHGGEALTPGYPAALTLVARVGPQRPLE